MEANLASPQLIWQLIKKNNAYVKRNVNNTWFSHESGNLTGQHSYKYSGLCNDKTLDIKIAKGDDARALTVTRKTKKAANQPAAGQASCTMKKPLSRMQKAVAKEAAGYRPDLKAVAVARVCNAHSATRRAARTASA